MYEVTEKTTVLHKPGLKKNSMLTINRYDLSSLDFSS